MPETHPIPLPTPFPVGPVNAYLLTGPEPALIDPGLVWPAAEQALATGLKDHGLKCEDVRHILLTHRHVDHSGAAARLCAESGATLYAHASNHWFSDEDDREGPELMAFLLRCGVDQDLLRQVRSMFELGRSLWGKKHFSGDGHRLADGTAIKLGQRRLQCFSTPGHSPDHLCFLDAASKDLFTGDMLLEHITSNPLIHLRADAGWRRSPSLLLYLDSLERIAALRPGRALPGHGPVIEDVPAVIQRNRRHIEKRQQAFAAKLSDAAVSPDQLALAMFGPRDPVNHMLAVSETVAYLDLLERDGQARVDWDGPIRIHKT